VVSGQLDARAVFYRRVHIRLFGTVKMICPSLVFPIPPARTMRQDKKPSGPVVWVDPEFRLRLIPGADLHPGFFDDLKRKTN
jgi:hypothetical protein